MPERSQRVVLVRHTLDPEALTALGARLCYAGGDVDRLLKTIEEKDQRAFVERVMAMGHESVLEHASFTFLVEGREPCAAGAAHAAPHRQLQRAEPALCQLRPGASATSCPPPSVRWALTRRRSTTPRWRRCRHGTRAGRSVWATRGEEQRGRPFRAARRVRDARAFDDECARA